MHEKQQIQQWLDKLRAGTLAEDDFQQELNRLNGQSSDEAKRQRLLYLQTKTTGVNSEVLGMALGRIMWRKSIFSNPCSSLRRPVMG